MRKVLAPEVTNWPDENLALVGSQCDDCEATVWPRQDHCPRCSGPRMQDLLLPRQGTLEAWTTQGFVPKLPFGVGLIRLGDVIQVEARLTESDPAKLKFGMDVELTMVPFYVDDDGTEILTWAFQPV